MRATQPTARRARDQPRPESARLLVGVAAAILALTLASRPAGAQERPEVALTRDPPFDAWCIAPLCAGGSAAVVSPPLALAPTSDQGFLEKQLRTALADRIQRPLSSMTGRWNNRATRDALRAILATLTRDAKMLAQTGGLGAAAVRVGLVYAVDRGLATDPDCADTVRLDAIYEGLALSPLGALGFTEATQHVAQRCVDTAKHAEHMADRALLAALAPAVRPLLAEADQRLREVRAKCDPKLPDLDGASTVALTVVRETKDPTTLAGLARAMDRLRFSKDALANDSARLADSCSREIATLAAMDTKPLDRLVAAGLAEAPARALVDELAAEIAPCSRPASCQARDAVVGAIAAFAQGRGLSRDQLVGMLRPMVASVVPAGEDPGIALAAMQALEIGIVDFGGAATIDPDTVVRELEKRYELRDGVPTPRTLLGLGPSPWIVELNGGVPKLATNDVRFIGDTTLGYESKSLGVVVRGALRYYDFSSRVLATDNLDVLGSLESWLVTGDNRSPFRLEGRLAGGTEYIDTTTLTRPAGLRRTNFGDYDSLLIRGSLLLGFGLRLGERFSGHMLVGGGGQYETHDSTSVDQTGIKFNSPDTWDAQGSARLDVRYRIVPSIVGARVHGDGVYFSITREELAFNANTVGATQATVTSSLEKQLSLSGRLFVDADLASFAGFVPAVFGGLDYVLLTSAIGERGTSIPVVGIGIVRPR